MKAKRLWIAGAFTSLLVVAMFVVGSDTQAAAEPGTTKQIVPGVWFREGDLKNLGHCNNIIIEMKDYLIVVDANFPSGARLAMAEAKKLSSKPVKYVFDTHHHGDHAYGNPVWTKAGATTLAYQGVVDEMNKYEPARWLATGKTRKDVGELNLPAPEKPQQTFTKTPFVLKDSTREVQFHFLGWAHTRGDGFVYLPKEGILCTGDAVANGPFNYTADGNIGNWPKVARAAQKLKPTYVLPGHGVPGGMEVLTGQEKFMTELHDSVQKAMKQGKKLDDLVTMEGGKPKSTTLQLSAEVKNWVGPSLAAQVKDAFEEISQGKPHGDLPHE